jgi:hypothetical protein
MEEGVIDPKAQKAIEIFFCVPAEGEKRAAGKQEALGGPLRSACQ